MCEAAIAVIAAVVADRVEAAAGQVRDEEEEASDRRSRW